MLVGIDGRPLTAPEAFDEIARWLDLSDEIATRYAALHGETLILGDDVQKDLRRLASRLRDSPEVSSMVESMMWGEDDAG